MARIKPYRDEGNIKVYLRNIFSKYLNYEGKLKEQKIRFPHSKEYIPRSEEMRKDERDYMKYEERVFRLIGLHKINIKSSKNIEIKVKVKKETKVMELRDFLISENILIGGEAI